MNKRQFFACAVMVFAQTPAWAGSVMSDHIDIAIEGGLTGGYFYSTNTGSGNNDNLLMSDGMVEIVAANPIAEKGNGYIGIGNLKMISILDGNGDVALGYRPNNYENTNTPAQPNVTNSQTLSRIYVNKKLRENVGIYFGYVEINPVEGFAIELGQLKTRVGVENSATYKNKNALLGALWHTQPNYYGGVRLNLDFMEKNRLYLEMNDDVRMDGEGAFAGGLIGEFDVVKYQISYFDANRGRNLVDLVVSSEVPFGTAGININYQKGDSEYLNMYSPFGSESDAWGLAAYVNSDLGDIQLPFRLEYLRDNSSALYRVDYVVDTASTGGGFPTTTTGKVAGTHFQNFSSMYSLTASPTFKVSDASFLRLEIAYVSAKNFIFRNGDSFNNQKFDKLSVVLQGGYRF